MCRYRKFSLFYLCLIILTHVSCSKFGAISQIDRNNLAIITETEIVTSSKVESNMTFVEEIFHITKETKKKYTDRTEYYTFDSKGYVQTKSYLKDCTVLNKGGVTQFIYDNNHNLIKSEFTLDWEGDTITNQYFYTCNIEGQIVDKYEIFDTKKLIMSRYKYDKNKRIIQVISTQEDGTNITIDYFYNSHNEIIQVTATSGVRNNLYIVKWTLDINDGNKEIWKQAVITLDAKNSEPDCEIIRVRSY